MKVKEKKKGKEYKELEKDDITTGVNPPRNKTEKRKQKKDKKKTKKKTQKSSN